MAYSAQSRGGAINGAQASSIGLYNTVLTNNSCLGNGGGIYAASFVDTTQCSMTNNTAGLNGGAIYADFGATSIIDACLLTGNSAKQSGGAWFGFGNSQQLSLDDSTSFSGNQASCCYAAGYGSKVPIANGSNQTCADTDSGEGGSDCCYDTQYSDGKKCVPCLEGGDCTTVGSSLATQSLKSGRWRASQDTTDIRKCWVKHACTGGGSTAQNTSSVSRSLAVVDASTTPGRIGKIYCAPGYQGPCEYSMLIECACIVTSA